MMRYSCARDSIVLRRSWCAHVIMLARAPCYKKQVDEISPLFERRMPARTWAIWAQIPKSRMISMKPERMTSMANSRDRWGRMETMPTRASSPTATDCGIRWSHELERVHSRRCAKYTGVAPTKMCSP